MRAIGSAPALVDELRELPPSIDDAGARVAATRFFGRHPWLWIFAFALVLRVVLATWVFVAHGGHLFGDETMYENMAKQVVDGRAATWDHYTKVLYWQTATITLPLTALFWLFGPIGLLAQLVVATYGATAAALTGRLASFALPRRFAVGAGVAVAVFPSQILWSSITLKDAAAWAIAVAIAVSVASAHDRIGRPLLVSGTTVALLLFALGHTRLPSVVVAAWAVVLASWFGRRDARVARMLGAIAIAVLVPWLVGTGPAGIDFARNGASNLEEKRAAGAENASTAIVDVPIGPTSGQTASARASATSRAVQRLQDAASALAEHPNREALANTATARAELAALHGALATVRSAIADVRVEAQGAGSSRALSRHEVEVLGDRLDVVDDVVQRVDSQVTTLDRAQSIGPVETTTTLSLVDQLRAAVAAAQDAISDVPPESIEDEFGAGYHVEGNLAHLPRGLSVTFLEPKPWAASSNRRVQLVRWEMVLWYLLLVLAVAGVARAVRKPHLYAFPLLYGAGQAVVFALAEGNFGTAYRHRGELVWVVALLAASGAWTIWTAFERRRLTVGPA